MSRPNTIPLARTSAIGALSRHSGVNIETIRYYERIGLLPAPPRSAGRHCRCDDAHLRRLMFIRRSRALGFSLGEIRGLLGLEHGHRLTCGEVKSLTEQHITDMRGQAHNRCRAIAPELFELHDLGNGSGLGYRP
jgi:DNA-binding transcriptional MerR regulator